MKRDTVIVVDLGNYKTEKQEKVPFKAEVISYNEHEYFVKSEKTGKKYEIYEYQMLEGLEIEEIEKMLNLSEYGNW